MRQAAATTRNDNRAFETEAAIKRTLALLLTFSESRAVRLVDRLGSSDPPKHDQTELGRRAFDLALANC